MIDSDWRRIGRNVRQARIIRGRSQEDFAAHSRVSVTTLYQVERGQAISQRSLLKICAALGESPGSIRTRDRIILNSDLDCLVFRAAECLWTVELEVRAKVPEDDLRRIQDPRERLRLGRLGLVIAFFSTPNFIMPEGPGVVFIELYRRFADDFNSIIYRDCLLTCTQGRARVMVGETVVEMEEGDVMGARSKDYRWMEPIDPVGADGHPVILTWMGGVRVGSSPGDKRRARRRKVQGLS